MADDSCGLGLGSKTEPLQSHFALEKRWRWHGTVGLQGIVIVYNMDMYGGGGFITLLYFYHLFQIVHKRFYCYL